MKKHLNILNKSQMQAKFWVYPLIEMASIAMSNSNFDYANIY